MKSARYRTMFIAYILCKKGKNVNLYVTYSFKIINKYNPYCKHTMLLYIIYNI